MNKQIEQILDEIERQLGNKEEASNLDYRGLIPMGLALPTKEDMYK